MYYRDILLLVYAQPNVGKRWEIPGTQQRLVRAEE
jgi:hypothetical protein